MEQERFSISGRVRSFYYAGRGIRRFLYREHNARIHLAATAAVIVAGILLKVSKLEAAVLAAAVGLVWVAEMFNTCLERAMDLVSTEQSPEIGFVKDLAAAAVLVASVIAVVIGFFIFIPHIL
jgi:diacylglycerol kinase (ATP)